jgi:hypothetical protein
MIIAVVAVRVVQPAVNEIVDMIAMRNLFMSAVWTVRVRAVNPRRALHGICRTDRYDMFVHMPLVHVVEMTIMKIVDMAIMPNRGVSAVWAMAMRVVLMVLLGAIDHRQAPRFASASLQDPPDQLK